MVAKLADVGIAHMVDICLGQLAGSLSQAPGTIKYMPPEALEPDANYDTKLDIFSFGNLALFTLTQVFPVLKAPNYIDSVARQHIARSELERRADHVQQVHEVFGQQHALVRMVEQCLQDFPDDRPTINEVTQQLEENLIADCYEETTKLQLQQKLEALQVCAYFSYESILQVRLYSYLSAILWPYVLSLIDASSISTAYTYYLPGMFVSGK